MDVIAPTPQERAANGPHAGRERTLCRLVVESKVTKRKEKTTGKDIQQTDTRRKETDRKDETAQDEKKRETDR